MRTSSLEFDSVVLGAPGVSDGASIHDLVASCPPLDLNSTYSYLLLCEHYSATCVHAVSQGKSVGFISAYLPPGRPEAIFVWQVAVAASMRGHGLAMRMLRELLARPDVARCRYLETTVTPSNTASRRLFESLARMLGTILRERVLFKGSDFGEAQHEPEVLFTIGPLTGRT